MDFKTASGTVTFTKPTTGNTPVFKTVTVTVFGDTTAETDETFAVTLSSPSTGLSIGRAVGTGTILNDDPGAGVRLGIGDAAIVEGNSGAGRNLVFPVLLSSPSTSALSVSYTVSGVNATYGAKATATSDFGGKTSGSVSFPLLTSGKTAVLKTISIPIWADTRPESDETFTITISTTSGAVTVARSVGTGTIYNDD